MAPAARRRSSPVRPGESPVLPPAVLLGIVALSVAAVAPAPAVGDATPAEVKLPGTDLVALHISNGAKLGKDLPTRLKLLAWGDNEIVKKDPKNPDAEPTKDIVRVGAKTLEALSANQAKLGYDRVALDFDHNSLPGHKNFERHPRKVAAYGVPEIIEHDGLYLRDIEYTPSGEAFAREYCDLSPAPLLDANREVTFLHSAALTGQGAVVGLSFFSTDFLGQPEALAVITDQTMMTSTTTTTDGVGQDLRKLLCVLFGCPEGASDEDLLTAGKTYVEKLAAPAAAAEAMSAPDQQVIQALSARLDDIERDSLLSGAVQVGKIVPSSARTLPLADLRRIVAELPADQVPVVGTVALSAAAVGATPLSASPLAEEIRVKCGVSKEAYDRFNATAV